MEKEVKSCPWCGSAPEIRSKTDHPWIRKYWYIKCIDIFCPVVPCILDGYPTEEEIVEKWNQRK